MLHTLALHLAISFILSHTLGLTLASSPSSPRIQIIPDEDEHGKEIDGTIIPLMNPVPETAPTEDESVHIQLISHDYSNDVGVALTPDDEANAAEAISRTGAVRSGEGGCYLGGIEMKRATPERERGSLVFNWINALLVMCGVMALVISSR